MVVVDNKSILICGGMSTEFEAQRNCYSLDLATIKWKKKAPMTHPRLTSSGLFFTNGFVFAIGGNSEGLCERYNVDTDKWQRIPSFMGRIEGETSLYTFAMCMLRSS